MRNGKILNLARGATAIDAAFQIHTEVGLNMHGVEINGLPVSMSYELQNGDVVNVLTGEGRPALDWMRYAKARSTRAKLRGYFRAKQRQSLVEAGGIILSDFLETHHELLSNFTFLSADEDFGGIPREVSGLQVREWGREFNPNPTSTRQISSTNATLSASLVVAIPSWEDKVRDR